MSGADIQQDIQDILTNLDIVRDRIVSGYSAQGSRDPAIVQQEMELHTAQREKNIYDAKFLEEQYQYQKTPKKRSQTLQEFVLLFFYVSLGIFSVALIVYAFLINGQSYSAAAKMLALCIVMCIAITAILIKLA
jgi:uncharacterized membrane protein YcjF (UPF0283 family)